MFINCFNTSPMHLYEFKIRRLDRLGLDRFIWFKEGTEEILGMELLNEYFNLMRIVNGCINHFKEIPEDIENRVLEIMPIIYRSGCLL